MSSLDGAVPAEAAAQLGIPGQSVAMPEQRRPDALSQQGAVAVPSAEVTLLQLVAAAEQCRAQAAKHQGVLELYTVRDLRRTAGQVVARTRRKAHHEAVHHSSSSGGMQHRQEATRMEAFVKARCPGASHHDFLNHSGGAWADDAQFVAMAT